MRSIVGLALLMTGLSIGAYAYYPATVQQHISLANVTRVIAPVASAERVAPVTVRHEKPTRAADAKRAQPSSGTDDRSFSPGARLAALFGSGKARRNNGEQGSVKAARGGGVAGSNITTAALAQPRAGDPPKLVVPPTAVQRGWTTVVTPAISNRSGTPGSRPLKSSVPADGSARYALIRDIQRELKRVGCYWGKIDGDWGPGSKRAITGFVSTVNAALPTSDPDYILLALVRAQHGQVCGNSTGRAIIANADTNTGASTAVVTRGWSSSTRRAGAAVSAQRPRIVAGPRPAKRASGQRVAARPAVVPQPRPATRQRANGKRKPAPYGRMAVGGPRPSDLDATETAPGESAIPATHRARPKRVRATSRQRTRAVPAIRAPAPRLRTKTRVHKRKKARRRVARAARASPRKRTRRRSYRRRRSNPLRNILRQGVY